MMNIHYKFLCGHMFSILLSIIPKDRISVSYGNSVFDFYEVKSLSRVRLFVTPWTAACQAPLSMGFSRQEYWSGWPCPPLGDLPNPGIKLTSLTSPALAGGFFTTSTTWEDPICTPPPQLWIKIGHNPGKRGIS